jgi:hypothetical protein
VLGKALQQERHRLEDVGLHERVQFDVGVLELEESQPEFPSHSQQIGRHSTAPVHAQPYLQFKTEKKSCLTFFLNGEVTETHRLKMRRQKNDGES